MSRCESRQRNPLHATEALHMTCCDKKNVWVSVADCFHYCPEYPDSVRIPKPSFFSSSMTLVIAFSKVTCSFLLKQHDMVSLLFEILDSKRSFSDLRVRQLPHITPLHHSPVHPARKDADQSCDPADFPTVQWCSRSIGITFLLRR